MAAIKRQSKLKAQRATEYIIKHRGTTYRQAARMFGVSVNSIRARINYQYGSLAAARESGINLVKSWERPCLSCGSKERRAHGLFRCKKCRTVSSKIHDGAV